MNYRNILNNRQGFTVVELIVVIVVGAILATIVVVSYGVIQKDSMSANGETAATQVSLKARAYYSVKSRYPTLSELQSNDIAEAKLANASGVFSFVNSSGTAGAFNKKTYQNGDRVVYRFCSNLGGIVYYWDYHKSDSENPIAIVFGNGC